MNYGTKRLFRGLERLRIFRHVSEVRCTPPRLRLAAHYRARRGAAQDVHCAVTAARYYRWHISTFYGW